MFNFSVRKNLTMAEAHGEDSKERHHSPNSSPDKTDASLNESAEERLFGDANKYVIPQVSEQENRSCRRS